MMTFNRLDSKCLDLSELALALPVGEAREAVIEAEQLLRDVSLDIQQAMQDLRLGRERTPDVHLRARILDFQTGVTRREKRQREATSNYDGPDAA